MRSLDFSSWQALLSTLVGLAFITLIGVGVRLLAMQVVQQRRERENRQVNERLKTLIAAYKALGGSFTGNLEVSPIHLRDVRSRAKEPTLPAQGENLHLDTGSERGRRTRDAVEAALSDIILLGTEEQVALAVKAAAEMVAGRPIYTHDLVVSLRNFIRKVLDLDPIPPSLVIPHQGPARVSAQKGKDSGKGDGDGGGRNKSGGGGMGGGGSGGGFGSYSENDTHHDV